MNIPLKKYQADWVAEQITSGRFESELDVIEDAIAAKMKQDAAAMEADTERLRERLKQSIEQAERGQTVPADAAFFQRLYDRIEEIEAEAGK